MPDDQLEIYTQSKIYAVPNGINELMNDIAKEVLRAQPKNIYNFISQYLITLLKVREAIKVAVPIIEKDFEVAKADSDFINKFELTQQEADKYATIIQAAYRGYTTRKKLHSFVEEFKRASRSDTIDWSIEEGVDYNDPIFNSLSSKGYSKEQAITAATKIQAKYRGYRVRKLEKKKGLECLIKGVPSHESWRHDWLKEPIIKSTTLTSQAWRHSYTDFHKNYTQRQEGDRLHLETIFRGKYEDYASSRDGSCHDIIVPTRLEALDIARPCFESSTSEELIIYEGEEKKIHDVINSELSRLKETRLTSKEKLLFHAEAGGKPWKSYDQYSAKEKVVVGAPEESVPQELSRKPSVLSAIYVGAQEGPPKDKGSKTSLESKRSKLEDTKMAPVLSVKSLSQAGSLGKTSKTGSRASKGSKTSQVGSKKSIKSSTLQEEPTGSVKSAASAEQDKISRMSSNKSAVSKVSPTERTSVHSAKSQKSQSVTSKNTVHSSVHDSPKVGSKTSVTGENEKHEGSNPSAEVVAEGEEKAD